MHPEGRIVIDEAALEEPDVRHSTGAMQVHSAPIAGDQGILDKSASVGSSDNIDAVSREIPDGALANDEFSSADHIDPVQTRPQPFDIEPFKQDLVGRRRGVDDNAIGSGHQDAGLELREDLNRLCNGDGTETTGVKDVDFPAGRCLRDRASEGLARRCAAAGIGIVARPLRPRSSLLGRSPERQIEWL